jgi:hypothetical protein
MSPAVTAHMSTHRSILAFAALLLGAGGCYSDSQNTQSTFPEPVEVSGPPGGDGQPVAYGGQPVNYAPQQAPYGYDGTAPQDSGNSYPGQPGADPSQAQPADPSTADVDDQQIQDTLNGYGTWDNADGYGQVWYPDATAVGADFMPYETNGSWAYTDAGWAFGCGWGWGWLPFHYGRWGWFGNRWGWTPGYHWSPAAVEWRGGGGYAGWRPLGPVGAHGETLRSYDAHWRFAAEGDMGRGAIHAHLANNVADAMHATRPVASLSVRGSSVSHVSSVMNGRGSVANRGGERGSLGTVGRGTPERAQERNERNERPAEREREQPTWGRNNNRQPPPAYRAPASSYRSQRGPVRTYQPMHSGGGSRPGSSPVGHSFNHGGGGHPSGGHASGGHSGGGGHHR